MSFTNDSKAVIALTTRLGNRKRLSLSPTRWHELSEALVKNGLTPANLFDPDLDLARIPGIHPETASSIRGLLSDTSAATVAAGEFERKGIWTLTVADERYPQALLDRLGHNAPPVVFGAGNASLLAGDGIGIVGSRSVQPEGEEFAQQIAVVAAGLSRSVALGGARGVSQLAMNSAYMAGGSIVGVVADSLQARIRKPDILGALDSGRTCLITQHAPSSGFSPGAAMGRNKVVYGLSEVTVVVAADEGSGGTWAGAVEALTNANGVVAVWRGIGEGPGNATLEHRGAVPIRSCHELADLLTNNGPTNPPPDEGPVQLGLLGTG